MCGIDGFFSFDEYINIKKYYNAHLQLAHRGPDDEGFVAIKDGEINLFHGNDSIEQYKLYPHIESVKKTSLVLGHRRLSIIDLSAAGHQPFHYKNNYLVFNGEIYNYLELKEELQKYGIRFSTHTDTEVFAAALSFWGIDAFHKFNGMWAAAIYNAEKEELLLCRDRFGIKPLYYHLSGKTIYFASEVKFILPFMDKIRSNPSMVYDYIKYGYINHTHETMFSGINQILPGEYAVFNKNGFLRKKYFKLPEQEKKEISSDKIKDLFINSVKKRMRSDVEVGSLLSGGIDSSSIVCTIHSENLSSRMQTFTITFSEKELDFESKYVDDIIQKTGFRNKKINLKPEVELIDKLTKIIEFPYRSSTELAMYNIYKYIGERTNVTVLLNGEGSDEIFGGYNFHFPVFLLSLLLEKKFALFRSELNAISNRDGTSKAEILKNTLKYFLRNKIPSKLIAKNHFFKFSSTSKIPIFSKDPFENILLINRDYSALPEYLLYGDKISMHFSLEVRVPFLDHNIVQTAAKIKKENKIHNGESKYILRKSMKEILPKTVLNRKDKKGFFTPHDTWIKTVLAEHIREEFEDIYKNGLFDYMDSKKIYKFYTKNFESADQSIIWRLYCLSRWKKNWGIKN